MKKEIDALQAEYSTCEIKSKMYIHVKLDLKMRKMFHFAESLAQYRRTLCRKPKETEAANEARKKHSRKQRVS